MSELALGKIIEGEAHRDAIHVAVAPVEAAHRLNPGERVGLLEDGRAGWMVKSIGVVDPFLSTAVPAGERFWLFLYPNTVTGMRHHWQHPAFKGDAAGTTTEAWDVRRSEEWLRAYAARMSPYLAPETAYRRLVEGLRGGELFAEGSDLHSLSELDDADELRRHAERVLGIEIDWGRFTFSCSC